MKEPNIKTIEDDTFHAVLGGVYMAGYMRGAHGDILNPDVIVEARNELKKLFKIQFELYFNEVDEYIKKREG